MTVRCYSFHFYHLSTVPKHFIKNNKSLFIRKKKTKKGQGEILHPDRLS